MPWGVAEARATRCRAGVARRGRPRVETWFNYHLPDQRDEIPAGMMIPDIPGSLNLRHPEACGALEHAARAAGATVHRGTRDVDFTFGTEPRVRWRGRRRRARGADAHHRRRRRPAVTGSAKRSGSKLQTGAGDQPRDRNAPRGSRGRGRRTRLPRRRRRPVHGDLPPEGRAARRAYLFPSSAESDRYVGRATSRSSSPIVRSSASRSASGSRPAGRRARSPRTPATTPGSTSRSATARS